MEPSIIEGFSVDPDRRELLKLLGERRLPGDATAGDGDKAPGGKAERISSAIAEALATARALIEPKGIYRIVHGAELDAPEGFAALEQVAICISTIGPALEAASGAALGAGRMLEGVALDAVGSAAAEAAAGYMNERIEEAAAAMGLRTSCRASPGYGDWDVAGQRRLFELLPADRIGVTLTPGCMMVPRKSVSFAVHMAAEPLRLRGENSCRNCDLGACPYRLIE